MLSVESLWNYVHFNVVTVYSPKFEKAIAKFLIAYPPSVLEF